MQFASILRAPNGCENNHDTLQMHGHGRRDSGRGMLIQNTSTHSRAILVYCDELKRHMTCRQGILSGMSAVFANINSGHTGYFGVRLAYLLTLAGKACSCGLSRERLPRPLRGKSRDHGVSLDERLEATPFKRLGGESPDISRAYLREIPQVYTKPLGERP